MLHTPHTITPSKAYTPTQHTPHAITPNLEDQKLSSSNLTDCPPAKVLIAETNPTNHRHQTRRHKGPLYTYNIPLENPHDTILTHLNQTPTIANLTKALTSHDHHIKTLVQSLPEGWATYNEKGSMVTKRLLLQSAWGKLKESDGLQAF